MSGASHEEIQKHVRVYYRVFAALAVLTVLTVGVSFLHMPFAAALVLALAIATVKGFLVAAYFMHLISERKVILVMLAFTMFFFFFLLIYPSIDRY
jgi:cytochrome c oxidase subunit 4